MWSDKHQPGLTESGTAVAVRPTPSVVAKENELRPEVVKALINTVDGGTGLRTKAALLSSIGVQEINENIPGPKVFFFWDFNNMGAPNHYGLRNEVTMVIKKISSIAATVFKNCRYELFRLGGDEFGGVIEADKASLIQEFAWQVQTAVQQYFAMLGDHPWSREQIDKARRYVAVREESKKIFQEYQQQFPDQNSLEHYINWLRQSGLEPPADSHLHLARQAGMLELAWARQRASSGADFMTFSPVEINVGEALSVDNLQRALALADKEVHVQKYRVDQGPEKLSLAAETKRRENDVYEQSMQQARELELGRLEKELVNCRNNPWRQSQIMMEKEALLRRDPVLGGVYRLDYIRHESLQSVLKVRGDNNLSAMVLDLEQFGSINNHFGYSKGDEVMRDLITALNPILKALNKTFVLRAGGGKIILVGFDNLAAVSADIQEAVRIFEQSVQAKLSQQWGNASKIFAAYVEAGRQQALGDYSMGENNLHEDLKFGRVTLRPAVQLNMRATDKWSKLMDIIDR